MTLDRCEHSPVLVSSEATATDATFPDWKLSAFNSRVMKVADGPTLETSFALVAQHGTGLPFLDGTSVAHHLETFVTDGACEFFPKNVSAMYPKRSYMTVEALQWAKSCNRSLKVPKNKKREFVKPLLAFVFELWSLRRSPYPAPFDGGSWFIVFSDLCRRFPWCWISFAAWSLKWGALQVRKYCIFLKRTSLSPALLLQRLFIADIQHIYAVYAVFSWADQATR